MKMRAAFKLVNTIPRRQGSIRSMIMDAHLRNSHSRMFIREQKPPPPPEKPPSEFQTYIILFWRASLAAGMIYYCTEYIADITLCEGPSMAPTIRPKGEIVLIDKRALRLGIEGGCHGEERANAAMKRQEEYEEEHKDDTWYEPRISVSDQKATWSDVWQLLTTPISVGDVVVLKHPRRNGTVCKRVLGLPGDQVLDNRLSIVPDGHLWVEGDNPANSSDSRNYGPIPVSLVVGRVLFRIWPLRGNAVLLRGHRPRHPDSVAIKGTTVLPAGYEGQHIRKTQHNHN